ncbi:hypothetical protein FWH30_01105 [Microgenomates group bacterium]|nr:hypothetical protein [Microgenomates group bacterium]
MQDQRIFAHWPDGQRLTANGRGGVIFTKDGEETILDRIDEYAAPAYEELDRYTSAEIEEMNREEMDREIL